MWDRVLLHWQLTYSSGRRVYFQWKITNGVGPFLTSGSLGESWQRLLTDHFSGWVVVIVVQSFLILAIFQCHRLPPPIVEHTCLLAGCALNWLILLIPLLLLLLPLLLPSLLFWSLSLQNSLNLPPIDIPVITLLLKTPQRHIARINTWRYS
jgi:hypothetical protein